MDHLDILLRLRLKRHRRRMREIFPHKNGVRDGSAQKHAVVERGDRPVRATVLRAHVATTNGSCDARRSCIHAEAARGRDEVHHGQQHPTNTREGGQPGRFAGRSPRVERHVAGVPEEGQGTEKVQNVERRKAWGIGRNGRHGRRRSHRHTASDRAAMIAKRFGIVQRSNVRRKD